jgi:hypothetical protein
MTIGEKSSEYAEKSFTSADISNSGKHDVAFHSYIAGANWMLEKAIDFIRAQYSDCEELAEEKIRLFKESIEE